MSLRRRITARAAHMVVLLGRIRRGEEAPLEMLACDFAGGVRELNGARRVMDSHEQLMLGQERSEVAVVAGSVS